MSERLKVIIIRSLSVSVRVIAVANVLYLAIDQWTPWGRTIYQSLRSASLADAMMFWLMGSSLVLPLLVLVEFFLARGRTRERRSINIDACFAGGWFLTLWFLAIMTVPGVAGS